MNVLWAAAVGLLVGAVPPAVAERGVPGGAARWSLRYLRDCDYATDTASLVARLQDRGPSPEEVAATVEQLGSHRYQERRAATRRLNLWGEAAVSQLAWGAATATDVERRRRIGRLLRRIAARDTRSEDVVLLAVLLELAQRRAAVTPAALELLPHLERPGLRAAAAWAAWSGAQPADAPLLREATRHADADVQAAAATALECLAGRGRPAEPFAGSVAFTEEFRGDTERIDPRYGRFTFHGGGRASVADGRLSFDGQHEQGDQRLVIDAIDAIGRPSFPDPFTIRAKLGGDGARPFNLHVGVSVGNCRVLFHPGCPGGGFRAQTVDKGYFLFTNRDMGFTPAPGALHEMTVTVRRNDAGGADFRVTVTDGQTGEKYTTDFTARPDQVGPFVTVSLDRGGGSGGTAFFGPLTLNVP